MILEQKGREILNPLLTTVARGFRRLGFTPTAMTFTGFLLNVVSGVLLAMGYVRWGGVALLVASPFDALDGMVARVSGRVSRFGAFWDSTLDRFDESAIFLGLMIHYTLGGEALWAALSVFALSSSLLVSYVRARAEALGIQCKVGFAHRPMRMAIMVVGLILGLAPVAIGAICVLATITVLHRIYHVWRMTGGEKGGWELPKQRYLVPGAPEAGETDAAGAQSTDRSEDRPPG